MTDHLWSLRDTAAVQPQFEMSQEVALADFFTDGFFLQRDERWSMTWGLK